MKKLSLLFLVFTVIVFISFDKAKESEYRNCYFSAINSFNEQQSLLLHLIKSTDLDSDAGLESIREKIEMSRLKLKAIDFWLRYLEPIAYKKINGPLPVEWENEVFEKWEKPYKREGAGLTLAELYLDEDSVERDTLLQLIQLSLEAVKTFQADSITKNLETYHHFFLANRLFLMNLAAIYTTGFECPNSENIIPELRYMMKEVKNIYHCYNQSFSEKPLPENYLDLYDSAINYVNRQPSDFSEFDHFSFLKDFVNPLFSINQQLISSYRVVSNNFNDYSLNYNVFSIFDKTLYRMQHPKGVFSLVDDKESLVEIDRIGKLLFYDPILSGNNKRSCASCHNPKQYFTDTTVQTPLHFDRHQRLLRNVPSLVNVVYNHLLMLDGKHISLQAQATDVMSNSLEMAGAENNLVQKVSSCKEYKTVFKKLMKLAPGETEVSVRLIVSAITFYYSKFSDYYAPFDDAMNHPTQLDDLSKKGFNIFMSKAECATCHFVPFFNGVKPPYTGSEFEVLGVPSDTSFIALSSDSGRYGPNPVSEMMNAFRTGNLRNIQFTKPYMHNGVFHTLEEVVDFYDAGGGQGRGLNVSNQTLSPDSLRLTVDEKKALISFMMSLNEKILFEEPPAQLPISSDKTLNARKIGGEY